jgi:hypothetical protein
MAAARSDEDGLAMRFLIARIKQRSENEQIAA